MANSDQKTEEPTDDGDNNEDLNLPRTSATKTKSESLKELATCPICLERLVKPKMLPCQHTFCLSCLMKCSAAECDAVLQVLRCPQCRAENPLPKDGVAGFPVNIHLQSILDLLDSDPRGEAVRCSTCQTLCNVTTCRHCDRWYCLMCMERHLGELKEQLTRMLEQMQTLKDKLHSKLNAFEEYCTSIKSEIRQSGEKQVKKLLDTVSFLQHHVDEVYNGQESSHKGVAKRVECSASKLQQVVARDYDNLASPEEKVTLFLALHSESEFTLSEFSSLDHTNFNFDPDSLSITVDHKSELIPGQQVNAEDEEAMGESCRISDETKETADAHSRFYRAKSFMPKSKLGLGLLQRPSGIAVSPWSHEIFVVAMDNHRVFAFDLHSGKLQRSFGSRGQKPGEFLCPFGIALVPNRQLILVTDKWKHCIHVFDSSGQFQRQVGSKGRSPGRFRSPESICLEGG